MAEKKEHPVVEGECVSSIAYEQGLTISRIWDDEANSELRKLRNSPYVLAPGDQLVVPEKETKAVPAATGKKHVFRRRGVPEKLVVELHDSAGEPRANVPYIVDVDGKQTSHTTGENGELTIEWIRPNLDKAWILVDERDEYELSLGELDPVTEDSGVAGRLRNLGYLADDDNVIPVYLDDDTSEKETDRWPEPQPDPKRRLRAAVRAFQLMNELSSQDGEIDDETRAKLVELHGC